MIDQLKFQPVDPVITAHSNAAGRNPGQETEDGEFRHSIARLLSVRPGRHQIPGGIPTKGASAGQIFYRIVTIFTRKPNATVTAVNMIYTSALFSMWNLLSLWPFSKKQAIVLLPPGCRHASTVWPAAGLPLCTTCPYAHIKPQRQRPFQPSIQIMIQYSSVMENFHYSHETRWIPRLPLCRWSPVQYIPGSLFNKLR